MNRTLRYLVAASVLVLAAAAFAAGSLAKTADTPFYLVPAPPPTNECHNVKAHCITVAGPWVTVPATGEATFLLNCPKRHGFVGGSDVQASSTNIHVWFDGQVGAPIGQNVTAGPFLLFHAVSDDGKPGSFAPILGCVKPRQQSSSRSTVSARRVAAPPAASTGSTNGTLPGAPIVPRAKIVVLIAGATQATTKNCQKREKLVGTWTALAFATSTPPDLSYAGSVKTTTVVAGNGVSATLDSPKSLPFTPLAEVQVGLLCAP